VTTSGGIGVLSADAAEAARLELPPIGDAALAAIRGIAPLADGRNPVDTSAGILGDLSAYARIAGQALQDREVDAVLCYLAHVPRNPAHWGQLREALYALRSRHAEKAFAVVALADAAIARELEAQRIAHFVDPTAAVAALAACAPRGGESRNGGHECPPYELQGPIGTEAQAKQALAAHGIAFAPERVVRDADQAAAAARELGYPVVLKIVSPDIAHKTEAGGVALDLHDEAALRAAVAAMGRTVRERAPQARIDGFLVARQLRGGVEVLVGTQCDPAFGPVVTVGAGGVLAELLQDVSVRLAPVTEAQALSMLEQLRIMPLLRGWRGAPAADLPALARQVSLLSRIAWSNRDRIASIDLNPVLALPAGVYAVDALIHPQGAPA
jgi:acetate---CoA ligase (ADP-forming)